MGELDDQGPICEHCGKPLRDYESVHCSCGCGLPFIICLDCDDELKVKFHDLLMSFSRYDQESGKKKVK